jgi:hypothetical protein
MYYFLLSEECSFMQNIDLTTSKESEASEGNQKNLGFFSRLRKNSTSLKYAIYLPLFIVGIILVIVSSKMKSGDVLQSTIISIAANLISMSLVSFLIIENLVEQQLNKQREQEREIAQKPITIRLKNRDNQAFWDVPLELRRGEFSRAELLGRMGTIPLTTLMADGNNRPKGARYEIKSTGTKNFYQKLNKVAADESINEIVIECSPDEFNQFDRAALEAMNSENHVNNSLLSVPSPQS